MSELTPRALYAAVAPLWERDAGFRPPDICDGCTADFTADFYPEDKEFQIVAALIRDRIVERLGEIGWTVGIERGASGEGFISLAMDGCRKPVNVSDDDRTFALIAAALKATEP